MAIIGRLKQNTAATVVLGPFVDATDGNTAEPLLTIAQASVRLSKNGGTFAQKADTATATHMENGFYSVALNATDTNTLGRLTVTVRDAGALPVRQDYEVLRADEFDALFTATGSMLRGIKAYGTAVSATSTTLVLAASEAIPDDVVVGDTLCVYDATNGFQSRTITDYVSTTDTATVDAWTVTPSGAITYVVFVGAPASTSSLAPVNLVRINNVPLIGNGTSQKFEV